MTSKLAVKLITGLSALAFCVSAFAANVEGKIIKLDDGGKVVTIAGKDGKEVTVSISSKRTDLQGVSDRSELKVGQEVAVEYDGDEAKKIVKK